MKSTTLVLIFSLSIIYLNCIFCEVLIPIDDMCDNEAFDEITNRCEEGLRRSKQVDCGILKRYPNCVNDVFKKYNCSDDEVLETVKNYQGEFKQKCSHWCNNEAIDEITNRCEEGLRRSKQVDCGILRRYPNCVNDVLKKFDCIDDEVNDTVKNYKEEFKQKCSHLCNSEAIDEITIRCEEGLRRSRQDDCDILKRHPNCVNDVFKKYNCSDDEVLETVKNYKKEYYQKCPDPRRDMLGACGDEAKDEITNRCAERLLRSKHFLNDPHLQPVGCGILERYLSCFKDVFKKYNCSGVNVTDSLKNEKEEYKRKCSTVQRSIRGCWTTAAKSEDAFGKIPLPRPKGDPFLRYVCLSKDKFVPGHQFIQRCDVNYEDDKMLEYKPESYFVLAPCNVEYCWVEPKNYEIPNGIIASGSLVPDKAYVGLAPCSRPERVCVGHVSSDLRSFRAVTRFGLSETMAVISVASNFKVLVAC